VLARCINCKSFDVAKKAFPVNSQNATGIESEKPKVYRDEKHED
jgi:hypothetical protein